MSLRLEMLQVARLAPKLLSDAADLVGSFISSQLDSSGGFRNRGGEPDLYYTTFGLEALAALRVDLPTEPTLAYLNRFGDGSNLDAVHLASLARCWANMPGGALRDPERRGMLDNLAAAARSHPSAGGGTTGCTVYSCFLEIGAYQDLGAPIPDPAAMAAQLERFRTSDGAYSNHTGAEAGSTPATAAAVTLARHLGVTPPVSAVGWLLARAHRDGGFVATPDTRVPDLLSTATALHALVGAQASIDDIKEPCIDFIDSLWTNRGGFYGHWADETLDCEYTYYGLLALGHLSL